MRVGLEIIRFDWPGTPENTAEHLRQIAQTADQAGFSSLWVMDHLFQMGGIFGPAEAPMLEGYTTSAFLAGVTRRVKLGVLVTAVSYRQPGLLVKMINTLDVLSGGRAYLGLGAAWYEEEARGLGLGFPALRERYERLEETLQIVRQMWADSTTPFVGQHYQLAHPLAHPLPLSRPHPPILIGGEGEQKTLRLVAKYADACNLYLGATPAVYGAYHQGRYAQRHQLLTKKLDVLRGHCDAIGRDYASIEKTVLGTLQLDHDGMSAQAVIELCLELRELGFDHVIFNMPDTHTIAPIETFGSIIIPAL